MTKRFIVTSPTGSRICAEVDTIIGEAYIDHFTKDDDGTLEPKFAGQTEVIWDSQMPELVLGQRQFIDEYCDTWLEDQLTIIEDTSTTSSEDT